MSRFKGSKKIIAPLTGLTERTVHYYTDCGLVVPDIANPEGRGTTRIYSFKNIVDFLIVKKLVGLGLSLKIIKQIMDNIRIGNAREIWLNRADGSRLYLIIDNITTPDLSIRYTAVADPKDIKKVFLEKGTSRIKIEKYLAQLKTLTVEIMDKESVLILNLSKLVFQAEKLL
jgi:DNA-binding transcriptional MerR regulator